jgi:uncharacterized protein YecE (DUF72 family)
MKESHRILVGPAGWSYKEWSGIVYPAGAKPAEKLETVARFFSVVEINNSFYGHIKPAVGREWCRIARTANPNFLFTAKLNRAFTHASDAVIKPTSAKAIHPAATDERDAKAGLDSLANENMLGAVLVQFPISFKNTGENRAYVDSLAKRFAQYPLVLEIRHASWNQPEVLDWLIGLGVGFCNIDQPLLGRALRPASYATSSVGYIRLHGRNYGQWFSESTNARDRYDYLYTRKELEGWTARIQEVAAQTRITFAVTNNHNIGKSAVNAIEIENLLTGKIVPAPALLIDHYPGQLASITKSDSTLF